MVTSEQLLEHLGRRPFQPFRVVLDSGENLDVVRIAQAVVSRSTFVFGTPLQHFRRVPLSQIKQIQVAEFRAAS